jgi:DNA repair protein RadC
MATPREKLKELGPKALEDDELLAAILRTGTRNENVFQLSKRLLNNYDREEIIGATSPDSLVQELGMSFVQACQLIACIELGKRLFQKTNEVKIIKGIDDAYYQLKNMQFLRKEYLRGLYLNSRHRIIHDEVITIGSIDANIVHPREIFRPAIEFGATALILGHNHPSGDQTPSQNDIDITRTISQVGNLLQIPLLDHLIIGENGYTSLKKAEKME